MAQTLVWTLAQTPRPEPEPKREPTIPAKATAGTIRIATRPSDLALWQANAVAEAVAEAVADAQADAQSKLPDPSVPTDPPAPTDLVPVSTRGDRDTESSLSKIGGKGVFVKEVQAAVLSGEADIAVHSAKDLPSQTPAGLRLAATLERGAAVDVLVGCRLADLAPGATVATGAPRRQAQLLRYRPDLKLVDLRGNISTRLRALKHCDALVMAAAALERIGHLLGPQPAVEVLDPAVFVPQAGQGTIAVECRNDDETTGELLGRLSHPATMQSFLAERAFLARLGGDCTIPAGAYARFDDGAGGSGRGSILGFLQGVPEVMEVTGNLRDNPTEMGTQLAEQLLADQPPPNQTPPAP